MSIPWDKIEADMLNKRDEIPGKLSTRQVLFAAGAMIFFFTFLLFEQYFQSDFWWAAGVISVLVFLGFGLGRIPVKRQ